MPHLPMSRQEMSQYGWETLDFLFISGDAPHHVRRDIILHKYNYLDLPHEIERIFVAQMSKILKEINGDLNIIAINHEETPEVIIAS